MAKVMRCRSRVFVCVGCRTSLDRRNGTLFLRVFTVEQLVFHCRLATQRHDDGRWYRPAHWRQPFRNSFEFVCISSNIYVLTNYVIFIGRARPIVSVAFLMPKGSKDRDIDRQIMSNYRPSNQTIRFHFVCSNRLFRIDCIQRRQRRRPGEMLRAAFSVFTRST